MSARAVVIIEDDAAYRTTLVRVLQVAGFEPIAFESAEAYLKAPPVLALCILLDVELPGMSGLELLRHLQTTEASAPVVVMSGRPDARNRAERIGCAAFLSKPFESATLVNRLTQIAAPHAR